MDEPDYTGTHDDELRDANARFRAQRAVALRQWHGREMVKHRREEADETAERRRHVDNMFVLKDSEW